MNDFRLGSALWNSAIVWLARVAISSAARAFTAKSAPIERAAAVMLSNFFFISLFRLDSSTQNNVGPVSARVYGLLHPLLGGFLTPERDARLTQKPI